MFGHLSIISYGALSHIREEVCVRKNITPFVKSSHDQNQANVTRPSIP